VKLSPAIYKELNKAANIALVLLAVCLLLSFFAELNWLFDILSNFPIQYAFGGLILGIWFLCYKFWKQSFICAIIVTISTFQIFSAHTYVPQAHAAENSFKIVQYNRNYGLTEHAPLIEFIKSEAPDVIVIQEATQSHSSAAEQVRDIYPHLSNPD
jgi:endonuclease/exonuclease/phosphatase (EEP) superfamily protein YafD